MGSGKLALLFCEQDGTVEYLRAGEGIGIYLLGLDGSGAVGGVGHVHKGEHTVGLVCLYGIEIDAILRI